MRTIIAGSRTITDPSLVARAVAESGFEISMVLSGAARGVDHLGAEWARERGVPVQSFPADWKRLGRGAGPARNQAMVTQADALIAIWDGRSPGTRDVIERARAGGLHVFVLKS